MEVHKMFGLVGIIALVATLVTVNIESNRTENVTVSKPETTQVSE